jgi:hypothetical protein
MKLKMSFPLILLIILAFEKFIQHMFVTYAFAVNLGAIRETVAVDFRTLLVSGFFVGLLFLAALILMTRGHLLGPRLMLFLALFDFFAEFIAQGTLFIAVPLSFLVACLILGILFVWRRELFTPSIQSPQAGPG